MGRYVHSKWKKTQALLGNESVKRYIPETKRMTKESLQDMLNRYGMVYVKPDAGSFGNGVIRVESKNGQYKFQAGTVISAFTDYNELYSGLIRKTRSRSYLVQKGIHLLKYGGQRFDIRVMVQLSPKRQWESTGIVGRVAHPRKIVTNYHNGGTLMAVPTLLKAHMSASQNKQFMSKLRVLGVKVARQLQNTYPGLREIGIDIAVDKELHPWILEVNTCPDPYIFRILKDKSVFRKVLHYTRTWGRFKKKS